MRAKKIPSHERALRYGDAAALALGHLTWHCGHVMGSMGQTLVRRPSSPGTSRCAAYHTRRPSYSLCDSRVARLTTRTSTTTGCRWRSRIAAGPPVTARRSRTRWWRSRRPSSSATATSRPTCRRPRTASLVAFHDATLDRHDRRHGRDLPNCPRRARQRSARRHARRSPRTRRRARHLARRSGSTSTPSPTASVPLLADAASTSTAPGTGSASRPFSRRGCAQLRRAARPAGRDRRSAALEVGSTAAAARRAASRAARRRTRRRLRRSRAAARLEVVTPRLRRARARARASRCTSGRSTTPTRSPAARSRGRRDLHRPHRHPPRRLRGPRHLERMTAMAVLTTTSDRGPVGVRAAEGAERLVLLRLGQLGYVTTVATVLFAPYLTSVAETAACGEAGTDDNPCNIDLHVLGLAHLPRLAGVLRRHGGHGLSRRSSCRSSARSRTGRRARS